MKSRFARQPEIQRGGKRGFSAVTRIEHRRAIGFREDEARKLVQRRHGLPNADGCSGGAFGV
jgi:hypothetical protein